MKKNIKQALIYVLGLLFPTAVLAADYPNPAGGFLVDLSKFGQPNTFQGLLVVLINITLGIVSLLTVAFIIYGGLQYITSRGNDEQAEAGKKTLTNAIIGLVIVLISYTIVTVIVKALTGK